MRAREPSGRERNTATNFKDVLKNLIIKNKNTYPVKELLIYSRIILQNGE